MAEPIVVGNNTPLSLLIVRAATQLEGTGSTTVTAVNSAISKAISLVEFLKHSRSGLQQMNSFRKSDDGKATLLEIMLSTRPLDPRKKGY
jgi:hypothetical protein